MSEKYDTADDEVSATTSSDAEGASDDDEVATTSQTTSDSELQSSTDVVSTGKSDGNIAVTAPVASTSQSHDRNIDNKHKNEEECAEETPEARSSTSDGNMQVVAMHYNELKEAGRKERIKSRIFFMRNFNNWIKSQLINEYFGKIKQHQRIGDAMRVLDMCCGKGGDLLKWEKANITHLICTDIAEVSVDQCQRRYDDMLVRAVKTKFGHKFTAEFFACDSTLVRLRERYKDPSLQLNLVSCQFAFHYSFESLSQADCMVRNAAECLQPGGYFIATIPDANEIMRRLRASPNGKSFGNDIYNIEFISPLDPPPLFGAKYQFHLEGVVDCPEFLVHFPTLVKLCRKHGLKLDRKNTFAEYYKESIQAGRQLLQRMNGLETVYTNRCGNDEQFSHIRNVFGANRGKSFGTLSKSEWEATTLYLVCAFKKCKSTWDANVKPVFEFD